MRADGPIFLHDEHTLDQSLETAVRQTLDWTLSHYESSFGVSVADRFSKTCHDVTFSGHTMWTGLCAIFLCMGLYRRASSVVPATPPFPGKGGAAETIQDGAGATTLATLSSPASGSPRAAPVSSSHTAPPVSAQPIPRRCTIVLLCLLAGLILVVQIFLLLVNFEHYTLDIFVSLLLILLTMTSRRTLRFVYNCNFVAAECWRFDDVFAEVVHGAAVEEGVVLREAGEVN